MDSYWECEEHNAAGNTEMGCPNPSHKTREQVLADQVVKLFRQREIEYGWVDDYYYAEKMQEIETFLREQVGKAYDEGAKDKESEIAQIQE